ARPARAADGDAMSGERGGIVGERNLRRAPGDSGCLPRSLVRVGPEGGSLPDRPATRGRDPEEIPPVGGLDGLELQTSARTSRERDACRGVEADAGIARLFRAARSLARRRHGGPVARRRGATSIESGTVLPLVRLGNRDDGGSARPSVDFGVGRTLIPDLPASPACDAP